MILQRTFRAPARLLVRFVLAHIFRLKEKERSSVVAKHTKSLCTLLKGKKKTSWYHTIKILILVKEKGRV